MSDTCDQAAEFDALATDGPPCTICRPPKRDGGGTVCGRCWRAA